MDQADQVRAYFDRYATSYDQLYHDRPETLPEDELVTDWLKDLLPSDTEKYLVEVGCGTGWFLDHVGWSPDTYSGFDISPGMIERARIKHSGYAFRIGDARQRWYGATDNGWAIALWSLDYIGGPLATLPRFRESPLGTLVAIVRTPLDPAPMSAISEPVYHEPWLLPDVEATADNMGLEVDCPLMFAYGGYEVSSPHRAHYLCLVISRNGVPTNVA
jgi:SAM-dependent methyltransferase